MTWRPPTEFPNIATNETIGIDTECKDDGLGQDDGPGWPKRRGFLAGISLFVEGTGFRGYFPVRHLSGGNLDANLVFSYFQNLLKRPDLTIVMMNATFDQGWLSTENIFIHGKIIDIQTVETLIDEELREYSLDAISKRRLGTGKNETLLREAAADHGIDPKSELWKLHAGHVGPYAEIDAQLPVQILQRQLQLISSENLSNVFDLESQLAPICFQMTRRGVRVDLDYAEQLNQKLLKDETEIKEKLWKEGRIEAWSGSTLRGYCDTQGIRYEWLHDEAGTPSNPTFQGSWLDAHHDPLLQLSGKYRTLNRIRNTYINEGILQGHYKGRVHAQFLPTAREEGGARAGRMSSAHPNLQQVPKRDETWAPLVRRCYLPDEGCWWDHFDYDAQEPRIQIHYAALSGLQGVDVAASIYAEGRKIYHLIQESAGISYDHAKTVYLAVSYNMMPRTLAENLKITHEEAKAILEKLYSKVPFLRELPRLVSAKAGRAGVIRTLGGRACHFDFWAPASEKKIPPVKGLENARKKWGNCILERAFTYKAFNRLIQGSAGDQTKRALVEMVHSGLDPQLPVHDEINRSSNNESDAKRQKEIMEHVFELKIPVVAGYKKGPNWGQCEKVIL